MVVMNNNYSYLSTIIFVLLFVLMGCASNTSISYHPPYIPIYVSVDTDGNVSVGASRTLATNFGTFELGTNIKQEIQLLRQSENFKEKRLLIVRIDSEVTTFELKIGRAHV